MKLSFFSLGRCQRFQLAFDLSAKLQYRLMSCRKLNHIRVAARDAAHITPAGQRLGGNGNWRAERAEIGAAPSSGGSR